jgi:hypothetical protein
VLLLGGMELSKLDKTSDNAKTNLKKTFNLIFQFAIENLVVILEQGF